MAVTPADFRAAKGHFFDLEAVQTDTDGWITAIAVNLQGIVGCPNPRQRHQHLTYRLLASVHRLRDGLPTMWISAPEDGDIQHVNIYHPREKCPFVGRKLPDICWGTSTKAWMAMPAGERTLTNLLEAARQILANANLDSRAR
jgi:hypothetical protein